MTKIDDRTTILSIVRERPEQLAGFRVEAIDGEAGRVADRQVQRVLDDTHLGVHIGGFLGLFGNDVQIEVDVIDEIDPEEQLIHVDRIADWVTSSPRVDS